MCAGEAQFARIRGEHPPEADLTKMRANWDRWYAFAAERLLVGQALNMQLRLLYDVGVTLRICVAKSARYSRYTAVHAP